LAKVTSDYIASLANPYTGPLATIPSYPALETKRQRSWVKGTFQVPAGAPIGFIVADPVLAVANDVDCVAYTTAAYAGTTIQVVGAGLALAATNSEYTNAQIATVGTTSIQARVVSAGLRIRYADTELNRGGAILALHHPQHLSLAGYPPGAVGGYTIPQLESYSETVRFPAQRKWMSIPYKPVDPGDLDFFDVIPPNDNGQFYMAFAIQGDATVATTYEFEFFVNHDITGATVRGKEPSSVDFVGFSAAHSAGASRDTLVPHDLSNDEAHQSFFASVVSHMRSGVSWLEGEGKQVFSDIKSIGQSLSPYLLPAARVGMML
jgi:hypothetical protein